MPSQLRPRAHFDAVHLPQQAAAVMNNSLLPHFTLDRFLSFKSWIFENEKKDLHNLLYISSLHATIGWGRRATATGPHIHSSAIITMISHVGVLFFIE